MTHHGGGLVLFAYWFLWLNVSRYVWHIILLSQHGNNISVLFHTMLYALLCSVCQSLQCSKLFFFLSSCDESANASSVVRNICVYVLVNESIWRHFHFNIDSTQQTKIISNASRLYFKLSISRFFRFTFCVFRFSFNALRYLNNQCMSIQCVCTFKLPCILKTNEQIFLSLSSLLAPSPPPISATTSLPLPSLSRALCICMRSIIWCTQFLSHLSRQFLCDLLSFWLFNSFKWLSMAVFCALYLVFSSLIFVSFCFQRC